MNDKNNYIICMLSENNKDDGGDFYKFIGTQKELSGRIAKLTREVYNNKKVEVMLQIEKHIQEL